MTAKSFNELGDIYQNSVLLTEAAKEEFQRKAQKVDAKQDIGELTPPKEGGTEKVKKDLDTPKEVKGADGKLTDGEKEIATPVKKKVLKESNMKVSTFDRIFNQIVNEDADDLNVGGAEGAAPAEGLNDEVPAIPGEEPAVEEVDPVAVVKEICALVCKLKEHFGITDEPEAGEEEVAVVAEPEEAAKPAYGEAVDAKELPDSAGKKLQGKNNDVGGTKVVKKKADSKVTVGDGKVEKAPNGEKLAGDKKAEIKGDGAAVKGGDKSAFED